MKHIYLLAILILFNLVGFGQGVPELMYYQFDGSGSTVPNNASAPVGVNPSPITGLTQGGTGQFGGALNGSGLGNGVATGFSTSLTGNWTMSFWVTLQVTTTLEYFLGDGAANSLRCFSNGVAGAQNIMFRQTGGTLPDVVATGVANGSPHVVHFVRDATAGNIKAYVDGVLNNTVSYPGAGNITGGSNFTIGDYSGGGALLSGSKIDEFRLYNRALDASEILLTYNQTLPIYSAPNDAGVTDIIEPTAGCVGMHDVKVEVSNLGINQINNLTIHWTVNGAFQGSVAYSQLLDTANGTGQSVDTVTLGTINFINSGSYNIKAWTINPNSQFDTINYNDTSSISLTGTNYPTSTLGGDTTICPDQPLNLVASSSGPDSLIWNDTVKTNSRIVTTPGTFTVEIYKNGCLTEDSITVSVHPAAPGVNLGSDSTFCYGDQITLNAAATGVTYLWQDNSTGSTFTVDTAGFYWVTLEDANTCRSSDSIEFNLFKDPSVTVFVSPSTIVCYGTPFTFAANGKTSGSEMYQLVVNDVNVGPAQVSNTYTSPTLNYGDTVRVDLVTDQCATTAYQVPSNELVMFINPQPVSINGIAADTVIENTKKSYAITPNSTSSYLWRVSGGSVIGDSTTFAVQVQWDGPNPNAWVSLTETDNSNCSYENVLPVNVISIIGIGEQGEGYLGDAYPNPADQSITIPVSSNSDVDISLGVYDLTGKVVKEVFSGTLNGKRNFNLPVEDLDEGMYFYKLTTSQGKQMTRKLLIRH